jgi:hypothetical protein
MSDDFDTVLPMARWCGSYKVGHRVHWIQGLRSRRNNGRDPGVGRRAPEWTGAAARDNLSLDCWDHAPAAIQASLPRNPDHAVVWWIPEWHMLGFSPAAGVVQPGSVGQPNAVPSRCATGPGRVHPGFPRAGNEGRSRLDGACAQPACPRCGGGLGISTAAANTL